MFKILFPAFVALILTSCGSNSESKKGTFELTTSCQQQCDDVGKKVDEAYSTATGVCQCQMVI